MNKLVLFIFLSLVISHLSSAEVRYVSHTGSNTPPYLTWETAADSIMSAINISSFGDTIYVANGVYEEQVVMIPGLSLIGAGMDSCVIDTRDLISSSSDISVEMGDSCLLRGFQILVANSTMLGWGIAGGGNSISKIELNKIISAKFGIVLDATFYPVADITVYNNTFEKVSIGVELFNSNSVIRKNIISTDPNSQVATIAGIRMGAYDFTYAPVIDSNYIFSNRASEGIYKTYGAKPIIRNNTIFLNLSGAMSFSTSDSAEVMNNLIYGRGTGISNYGVNSFMAINNYIGADTGKGIIVGPGGNVVKNNIITNADIGIDRPYGTSFLIAQYNNLWKNTVNYSGFTGDTTNLSVDPMVVNNDSTQGELDFHLQMFSPLIDRGDPDILDKDSSRSDIGLYGGPFGESYTYQDLPPRAPVNLTGTLSADTTTIELNWNKNTETDFNHYSLYRDTLENFTADSTTFIASTEDTFYLSIIPQNTNNFYYKLTAVDSQGNESNPSEELHVQITKVSDNRQFTINNYKLFQNYPNPFNPATTIGYRLKERGYVKLYVYDIKGELVETLVNKTQESGYYEVEFRGQVRRQETGVGRLASGIYIYQILVQNEHDIPVFSDIKKMVYIK